MQATSVKTHVQWRALGFRSIMHRSAMNDVFVKYGECRQFEGDSIQRLI